jgi:hypothetical protein
MMIAFLACLLLLAFVVTADAQSPGGTWSRRSDAEFDFAGNPSVPNTVAGCAVPVNKFLGISSELYPSASTTLAVVVYGGKDLTNSVPQNAMFIYFYKASTNSWDRAVYRSWGSYGVSGAPPARLLHACAASDTDLVLAGGKGNNVARVYTMSLSNMSWALMPASSDLNLPRSQVSYASGKLPSGSHVLMLFGGRRIGSTTAIETDITILEQRPGQKWETRTQVVSFNTATQPRRLSAGLVYVGPMGGAGQTRWVMFGGYANGFYLDETFTFELDAALTSGTWTQLNLKQRPTGRRNHVAGWNAMSQTLWVALGIDKDGATLSDAAVFDGVSNNNTTWVKDVGIPSPKAQEQSAFCVVSAGSDLPISLFVTQGSNIVGPRDSHGRVHLLNMGPGYATQIVPIPPPAVTDKNSPSDASGAGIGIIIGGAGGSAVVLLALFGIALLVYRRSNSQSQSVSLGEIATIPPDDSSNNNGDGATEGQYQNTGHASLVPDNEYHTVSSEYNTGGEYNTVDDVPSGGEYQTTDDVSNGAEYQNVDDAGGEYNAV